MGLQYAQTRAEDVVFRELFINPQFVADNLGTVTGALVYLGTGGATFDGTNDYVTYVTPTQLDFHSDDFSIEISANIASLAAGQTLISKGARGVNGGYAVYVDTDGYVTWQIEQSDGTARAAVTDVAVSVGFNHIACTLDKSSATGLKVYLNSVEATYSAQTDPSTIGDVASEAYDFKIGANDAAGEKANATIFGINVYNKELTPGEVSDRFTQLTFSEVDVTQLEFFLPLRSHYNNGASELTANLGIIGSDTIKWGDGNTASTFPTLLDYNGASFDGGDYILVNNALAIANTDSFTLGCLFQTSDTGAVFLMDCRAASQGFGILMTGSKIRGFTDTGGASKFVETPVNYNDGTWHSCIVSFIPGTGTVVSVYIDGDLSNSGDVTVFTNKDSVSPTIGCEFDFSNKYTGNMKFPFFWRIALTPTQAKWQHDNLFNQFNL